jgi:hypothetical protein
LPPRQSRLGVDPSHFSDARCDDAIAGVRQIFRHSRHDKTSHEVDCFTDFDARPPEG